MPQVIFNSELWVSGYAHKCSEKSNGLVVEAGALYISRRIDSFESGTLWNRMTISVFGSSLYRLSFFASDFKAVYHNGGLVDIDKIIEDEETGAVEKKAALDGLWSHAPLNALDIPLFTAKGRYFTFMLEFLEHEGGNIERLKIEFGRQLWTAHLPAIYQSDDNSFLNRFLGMLQGVYEDLEREIQDISSVLHIGSAEGKRLLWLSEWVCVSGFSSWPKERMRELIKNAYGLSKIKGTKECLLRVVALYTGEMPLIVEAYEALAYENIGIYGSDINSLTVIVREDCLPEEGVSELARLMDYYAPIHARVNIAVLKPFAVLGLHTYLGINARLSIPEALTLGEKAAAGFSLVRA